MLNSSCLGHDNTGYSARSVQLSQVAKNSKGRSGAASVTSLYSHYPSNEGEKDYMLVFFSNENGTSVFPDLY